MSRARTNPYLRLTLDLAVRTVLAFAVGFSAGFAMLLIGGVPQHDAARYAGLLVIAVFGITVIWHPPRFFSHFFEEISQLSDAARPVDPATAAEIEEAIAMTAQREPQDSPATGHRPRSP